MDENEASEPVIYSQLFVSKLYECMADPVGKAIDSLLTCRIMQRQRGLEMERSTENLAQIHSKSTADFFLPSPNPLHI